jgi:hypothetical protein
MTGGAREEGGCTKQERRCRIWEGGGRKEEGGVVRLRGRRIRKEETPRRSPSGLS